MRCNKPGLALEAVSKVVSGVPLVEQGLSFLQIKRVEAFSEQAIDRSQQFRELAAAYLHARAAPYS